MKLGTIVINTVSPRPMLSVPYRIGKKRYTLISEIVPGQISACADLYRQISDGTGIFGQISPGIRKFE